MKLFRPNQHTPFRQSSYAISLILAVTLFSLSACAQNITSPKVAATKIASAKNCSLHILLSNDDGWDAPGIQIIRGTLLQAGHRVTLVAPLNQQSGKGGALNTDFGSEVSVIEQSQSVWSVDGTPTDSIYAGLNVILADDPPDLVVSGANFGPNIGQHAAHSSGTVGAALAAHFSGFPAIALSTGMDLRERNTTPPFKSTIDGFKTTGAIAVGIITRLAAQSGCNESLPSDFALNINVPVPASAIKGIRVAPLSRNSMFDFQWEKNPETGKIGPGIVLHNRATDNPADDVEYHASGYVSITQINGDIGVSDDAENASILIDLDALLPASE